MDSSNYKFELVKHLIDRKLNQQLLQLKNIQTIQKTPQIMSDIVEKKLDKEEKIFYNIMKKELQKDFSDFRYLAKGAQGYVMLAKEKSTNKRFAIKGCQVRDDEGNVEEKDLGDAKNEIEIVSKCKGSTYVSNLIKCIDLKENQFMYLVLTECQGTLQEVVDSTQDKKLNEISAIKYSRDIAEGLLHIHSKGYLVNDLKMDNILIDYNGNAVVSDFGCAQKLKKQSDYVYYEYEGNTYFQAPECVDRNSVNLYEDEYKKLGVVTQMNPSQRSEACSFGYIIYTLVQGKKQAFNFIYSKHKPLEYDGTFQSYKYSQQLQNIIDGLTKFIPRDRLSIKEALEQLNEIISIEININQKFQVYVSEQTQILSQKQLKEVEFIESFDKKYYPIVKDEDTFIKELVFEKDFSEEDNENLKQTEKVRENQMLEIMADSQKNILQKEQQIINLTEELKVKNLQYENLQKSQQEEQEKLKKTIKEKENQISEIEVAQKENIQKKGQEIIDLTEKLQAKNKQYEDLQKSQQEEQEKLKQTVKDREDKILEIEDAYKKIIQKKEQEIIDLTEKLQAKNKQYENLQKSQQEEQEKLKQTVKDREDKILEIEDAYKKIIQKNEQEIIDLTGKLQNQNKEFENLQKLQKVEQEKFKKTVNERENQISELQATSKKNIQRKDEEIIDLKGKLQTKNQEVENLKTNLQNTQNLNISLQQEQDNLEINLQTKDEIIMQMEEDQQIQRDLIEQLKIQKLNLETQKSFFQIQKDNTEKIITQLEKGREHELNDKLLAVKIILLQ